MGTLHHSRVLFLESLVQPGRALQVLVNATKNALFFAVDEGLGGEIVDAVVETALDHLGVHLRRGQASMQRRSAEWNNLGIPCDDDLRS